MSSPKKEGLLAFSLYLLVATVMTWPLLGRLATHLPMGTNDLWQNYWNLWWWKRAMLLGQSPYTTDMLFHPEGTPLGLHTHSPATMLLTMPVNALFGMATAYNLAVFCGFVLAGFGGYLLAREYTRSAPAASLAGIVAAYFPQHVEQSLEHLNLASYWAMPLFVWALVRTVRRGGRWWIAAGLFFSLTTLLAWHYGLVSIILGIVVAGFEIRHTSRPKGRTAADLARAACLAAVLMAPFAWPIARDSMAGVAAVQKSFPKRSIDPLSLLVPHSGHPLWGSEMTTLNLRTRRYRAVGGLGYLGIVSLALAMVGTLAYLKRPSTSDSAEPIEHPPGSLGLWVSLTLFFLLLSFGDTPQSKCFESPDWLLLPFHWLKRFPLFGLVRLSNRFFVPAMLSLAVVVAMGADRLVQFLRPERRGLAVSVVALLMLLDFAWLPYPMRELPAPKWITALSELPPELAVLDIPSSHRGAGAIDMYFQTLHRRPILGRSISVNPASTWERFASHPQLRRVFRPFKEDPMHGVRPSLAESVREIGSDIVVVHLNRTREYETDLKEALSKDTSNFPYRDRLYDPSREMPANQLGQIRDELRRAFGPPAHHTHEVEIYLVD